MADQKIENLLNVSMEVTDEERQKSPDLEVGYDEEQRTWELIVKYIGDISFLREKYPFIEITELLGQYAIIIAPQSVIETLSDEIFIEFIEKPKMLYFNLLSGLTEACITPLQQGYYNPYNLFGQDTIVAVIDTGIDAASQAFRNADGSTRIINIWDQTTDIEFDRAQIDEALASGASIPGDDFVGHGTNVALIACGNEGVASRSDILVVKMGLAAPDSFPRTTQLMRAVDYVIRKGIEYGRPVAVNISFGNNYGDHTGTSLLETFLNDMAASWKCVICVGNGNEGLGATHAGGYLQDEEEQIVELAISTYETSVSIQIWKDYWDDFEVEIIMPSGKNLGRIGRYNYVNRVAADGTIVLTYYGQPSPYSTRQEIYIDLLPEDRYIQSGLWKLRLIPIKIVSGRYDMWLPAVSSLNEGTGFTSPDSSLTLTIPSTAASVISVGAYDSRTNTPIPFSGRGYASEVGATTYAKPDLVAPGVNVVLSETVTVSGTSFATPFVTGGAALLMEWGIVRGNDPYLYGEKVKAYMIKGARPLPGQPVPSVDTGWGALCVRNSLPD